MSIHEFGIMNEIMYNVQYEFYEPEEYNCISVDDNLIEEIINNYLEEFQNMKTYSHNTVNQGYGLDYCGITLIPPESLEKFNNIITSANKHYKSQELELLINKISEAIKNNKFLIHFGI